MSAYKGWIARVRIPVHQRVDEPMNPRYGDGSNTTFYTFWRPVTDSAGNVTDDESQVTVKVDGTALDPTDYVLTGAEGKIEMTSAPSSGAEVTITYYTGGVLGYVTSISLSVDRDSEAFYHLQSATPAEVVDGTIDITIDLERAFIDRNFMEIIRKDETAEVTLEIDIDGDGTYEYSIPCKISSFNPSIDIDGVVVASISLIGRSIS